MLLATFRADPPAIHKLVDQFNEMIDLSRLMRDEQKLTFVPGYPECGVSGKDNSVMRFIGMVAQFGSAGLVRVETPQPVRDAIGYLTIPLHHMEFEIDPNERTLLHVRLVVCPLPTENWPDTIRKYDCVWRFSRRAITPDQYHGAAFYHLQA